MGESVDSARTSMNRAFACIAALALAFSPYWARYTTFDAKGSKAFQTNRNLTLSSGAWAESVPNLDIETNDVKCSHASTVGPIDEEQRFYLESRGIPPEIAERLVVLGFFDEVLEQLPVGPLAAQLRELVSAKLQRKSA